MIYLAGWAIAYFFLLLPPKFLRKKYGAFITLFLLGLVVVLRGRVGVDVSFTYQPMAENLDSSAGIEPLFFNLVRVLVFFFPTPLLAVTMGLGLVFVALQFIYVCRADRNELFFYQAFYIPALFFAQGTNLLRFGMAVAVLLLLVQCVNRKQMKWAAALAVIAVLTHYSSMIFLILWGASILEYKKKSRIYMVIGAIAIFILVGFFARNYLLEKWVLYFVAVNEKPSAAAGLGAVGIQLVMAIGLLTTSIERAQKLKTIGFMTLGTIVFWYIGYYSVAATRLLLFPMIVLPLAALVFFAQRGLRFGPKFRAAIMLAGLLGAAVTYRNMLSEPLLLDTPSPSLPYKFFWQ